MSLPPSQTGPDRLVDAGKWEWLSGILDRCLKSLDHELKKLRLPTFLTGYTKLAKQCASENKDHAQYLLHVCELRLIERERWMIEQRIKAVKFPATKSLDSFDFKLMASLNEPLTMEFVRCEFIDKRDNVIALGPSGSSRPSRNATSAAPSSSPTSNLPFDVSRQRELPGPRGHGSNDAHV
ncbi:MAG: ATP-binding protein [Geminicoccaceae bacterium]